MRKNASAIPLVLLVILLAGGVFAYVNRKPIGQKADQVKKYGARAIFSSPEDIVTTSTIPSVSPTVSISVTPSPMPATASGTSSTSALPSITTLTETPGTSIVPTQSPSPLVISASTLPVSGPHDEYFVGLAALAFMSMPAIYYFSIRQKFRRAYRGIQIL
jgi:hypothetical protein